MTASWRVQVARRACVAVCVVACVTLGGCGHVRVPPVSSVGGGPPPTSSLHGVTMVSVAFGDPSRPPTGPARAEQAFIDRLASQLAPRGISVAAASDAATVRVTVVGATVDARPRECVYVPAFRDQPSREDCDQELTINFRVLVSDPDGNVAVYEDIHLDRWHDDSLAAEIEREYREAADVALAYLTRRGL